MLFLRYLILVWLLTLSLAGFTAKPSNDFKCELKYNKKDQVVSMLFFSSDNKTADFWRSTVLKKSDWADLDVIAKNKSHFKLKASGEVVQDRSSRLKIKISAPNKRGERQGKVSFNGIELYAYCPQSVLPLPATKGLASK